MQIYFVPGPQSTNIVASRTGRDPVGRQVVIQQALAAAVAVVSLINSLPRSSAALAWRREPGRYADTNLAVMPGILHTRHKAVATSFIYSCQLLLLTWSPMSSSASAVTMLVVLFHLVVS